ncbi:MAG TPA: FG-GAP-like repeat-containing protein [Planctomycetota bacterium]|nr:FG-GAP-like repeat-containing protein [Planctomycetota bacterium]
MSQLSMGSLFVAAVAAVAPAQGVILSGPVDYPPGAALPSYALDPLRDLDADGRWDVVEFGAIGGLSQYRYRLGNPDGTFGPLFNGPSGSFGPVVLSAPSIALAGRGYSVVHLHSPTSQIRFEEIVRTPNTFADPLSAITHVVPAPLPGVASMLPSGAAVASGAALYRPTFLPHGFVRFVAAPPVAPGGAPTLASTTVYASISAPEATVSKLIPADIDGDGDEDVYALHGSGLVEVVLNVGGAFVPNPGQSFLYMPTLGSMFAGDIDGDLDDDLAFTSFFGTTAVFLATPTGGAVAFSQAISALPPTFALRAVADLDGDGDGELVGEWNGQIRYADVDAAGVATLSADVPAVANAANVAPYDLDADGRIDLVGFQFGQRVWFNRTGGAPAPARPGTGDGVALLTSSAAPGGFTLPLAGGSPYETREAFAGGMITFVAQAPGLPAGSAVYLVGDLYPIGAPLPEALPGVWTSFAPPFILAGALDGSGEAGFALPVPAGLGLHLATVWQAIVPSASASNGVFAASDAVEFQM